MGLLGFALDPNFYENGHIYALYIVDRHHLLFFGTPEYDPEVSFEQQATIGRLTRYTVKAASEFTEINYDTRKILMGETVQDGFPILMLSHGVGDLQFGSDGTLLVSCGDGASYNGWDGGNATDDFQDQALEDEMIRPEENVGSLRAQMLTTTTGKMLRLDPATGEGLPSNPFFDAAAPKSPASRTFALGFRNPYRFTVRPNTGAHLPTTGNPGAIYVGDVGSIYWEEINVITEGGQNFGWPLYEGHWELRQFQDKMTPHPDALNPFGNADCGTHFLFQELIQQARADGNYSWENPCNSDETIDFEYKFIHQRPAVTYRNPSIWELPDSVLVPRFDANGEAIAVDILDTDEVEGEEFQGWASIGGVFYEGTTFPEKYHGAYFQTDFSGWIKAFWFDENNQLTKTEPFFTRTRKGNVAMTQHPSDGCLYYANVEKNDIRRICYGGDPPPIADFEMSEQYGASPLTVQFDASASYAPFGYPITLTWDFGDGITAEGMQVSHTFSTNSNAPKSFDVTLTVTDSVGMTATKTKLISLNNTPPEVNILSFKDGQLYPISDITILPLYASVNDAEHEEEDFSYRWLVSLNHNDHSHAEPAITERTGRAIIDPLGCAEANYWYTIALEVTDGEGLIGRDEKEIFPDCGDPIVQLFELEANAENNGVRLHWNVEELEQISHFHIQRTDGYLFEIIDAIGADAAQNYSYFDSAPLEGKNIYRIKTFTENGRYDFSNQARVFYRKGENVLLFPNPTSDYLQLDVRRTFSEIISLELFTTAGQLVQEWTWETPTNSLFETQVELRNLPIGVYTYRIKNGEEIRSGKLLIER